MIFINILDISMYDLAWVEQSTINSPKSKVASVADPNKVYKHVKDPEV